MRTRRLAKSKTFSQDSKGRLIEMRTQPSVVRLERPTNLTKARALGYRAKQGFIVVRIKLKKGGRKSRIIKAGRKPSKYGRNKYTPKLSKRVIAEQRVARKYPNMEILNSYEIADDAVYKWFEVILVDANHPALLKDKKINWIASQIRRVYRGITSAGKKSRGLRNRGKGAEHVRPSVRKGNHK
jgi:large subunit ribosomal protein L15e